MREIPADVLTLLKSRSMVGANKPTHKLTIQGAKSGGADFDTLTATRQPNAATTDGSPSAVILPSKQVLYVYCRGDSVYQALAPDVDTFLGSDNTVTGETAVVTGLYFPRASVFHAPSGGLFLAYSGYTSDRLFFTKILKSAAGDGSDWAAHGTVQNDNFPNISASTLASPYLQAKYLELGIPYFTPSGRWVLPHVIFTAYLGSLAISPSGTYLGARHGISVSDDDGVTWSNKLAVNKSYANTNTRHLSRNIGEINGELWWVASEYGTYAYDNYYKSTDDGDTWSNVLTRSPGQNPSNIAFPTLFSAGGKLYELRQYGAQETVQVWQATSSPASLDDFVDSGISFTLITVAYNNVNTVVCPESTVIIAGGTVESGDRALGVKTITNEIYAKSINIDRSKDMASAGNIVLDNKNGVYSPDGEGDWAGKLMPNVQLEIEQGYGANLVKTFTGYIDSVEMATFPQELRLTCRDKSKLALDRIVTNDVDGGHYVKFASTTVETAFIKLAELCGLTTGTVEETGLTLASKMFSWESYADAFSWLAELAGFEWHVDEMGLIHFVRDATPENPEAAYVFREGEDIISLGYTISDTDLYYEAVVYGQDADGAVVKASAQFGAPLTYKLFSQKVLKIDAQEADTVAKCQEIANRAVALMLCRARVVDFAAIAVPWLQIGDFIQVIESSSTISELYRITDMALNQDPNGFTMSIRCYWYGTVSE